jgi:ubiquinone/menaquinone biosynthesis C-methylase UbiE
MEGKVTLLRCDPANLPFADDAIRSLQSPNGLHAFHDRTAAMREFERVIEPGGNLSGSVLIRGQRQVADALLATYERYGVFPMLRSREFVIQEIKDNVGFPHLRHETYGAVLFFHAQKP